MATVPWPPVGGAGADTPAPGRNLVGGTSNALVRPCRKRVPIHASPHRDYPDLVRVFCVPSRRIKTYKAGDETPAVPGAWVRDHLCGECPKRKDAPIPGAIAEQPDLAHVASGAR